MLKSVLSASLCVLFGLTLYADDVAAGGKVVCTGLSISAVGSANETIQTSCLSMDELEFLPYREFETSTLWTDGIHHFEGVALSDVLKHVTGSFTSIKLVAANDYEVSVPADEIGQDYPIIALRMDGEALDNNDKGPFWVVYPYDQAEEYRTSRTHSRSVWMLSSIEAYQ